MVFERAIWGLAFYRGFEGIVGTDNLFHIRKSVRAEEHRRKLLRQAPYPRVLIVCEGGKTEPNYFGELRTALALNRVNIVIADKKKGLDPKALVEYAVEELKKEPDFDHVYCVFDKDKHPRYNSAVDRIHSLHPRKGTTMHAITSVPCFEIWLLLHFGYTTKSYSAPLEESNAELVIKDLKDHLPNYEKGSNDTFSDVADKTEIAIQNAKLLERFNETSMTDNPSTKIHVLVEYLQELGKTR